MSSIPRLLPSKTASCYAVMLFTVIAVSPDTSYAQIAVSGSDWVQPGIKAVDFLKGGLAQFAAVLVGLAIMGYATVGALSGNPDWKKMGIALVCAIIAIGSPKGIAALLEVIQSGAV